MPPRNSIGSSAHSHKILYFELSAYSADVIRLCDQWNGTGLVLDHAQDGSSLRSPTDPSQSDGVHSQFAQTEHSPQSPSRNPLSTDLCGLHRLCCLIECTKIEHNQGLNLRSPDYHVMLSAQLTTLPNGLPSELCYLGNDHLLPTIYRGGCFCCI